MTRLTVSIKGSVLKWARESAGFRTPADAAEKIGVTEETYTAWEADMASPSVPQLRKVASAFGRPLAVFFLAEPPMTYQVLRDLRRLPGSGVRQLPVAVQAEINAAEQRREITIEMGEEVGIFFEPFRITAKLAEDPEAVGASLREQLGVSFSEQLKWKDSEGRASLNAWRSRIEAAGVLVFQATKFTSGDASGFAISKPVLPIVVVNRADSPTRRTFSLLHEVAHLMLRVSGVSELETDVSRPPEDQAIEVFCNGVAAAALMPRREFLEYASAETRGLSYEAWSDAEISDLARAFGVSREAAVRRLLTFGHTTSGFYRRKRSQYAAELAERQARLKAAPSKPIPRNMPQETISNLGRPMVTAVLGNYYQERITLSDVSGYLGLKTKHIPRLEQVAGLR